MGPLGTAGDGGGRSFTRMSGASSRKDRTGRQTAVRPRPGSGRTDCPVANTDCGRSQTIKKASGRIKHAGWRLWKKKFIALPSGQLR